MADRERIYKCDKCGNIVVVLHSGPGALVCCGEPMKLLVEQTADAATEKHVPVIERVQGGYRVKVGSVPHPMLDAHFIEWIELVADGSSCRRYLQPGGEPSAFFPGPEAAVLGAREYCNIHGLWKG
jgi:superoxide reductase